MKNDELPAGTPGTCCLRQPLDTVGWVILPGIAAGASTEPLAAQIGDPIAPWPGAMVQQLMPKAASTPNTYSGIFGLGRFPFHTDLAHWQTPPRYLLLRCVRGYADVPTILLDGLSVATEVGPEIMRRALVKPRRPQSGEVRLLRLLECGVETDIIRWDQVYLMPASRIGEEASERIRSHIKTATPIHTALVADGDVLILDNWRMLHSRPAIPEDRRDRHLERIYLRSLR